MIHLAQIRGLLLLTLKDVERGAGISASKLAKVERDQARLNDAELRALMGFYTARWTALQGDQQSLNTRNRRLS